MINVLDIHLHLTVIVDVLDRMQAQIVEYSIFRKGAHKNLFQGNDQRLPLRVKVRDWAMHQNLRVYPM